MPLPTTGLTAHIDYTQQVYEAFANPLANACEDGDAIEGANDLAVADQIVSYSSVASMSPTWRQSSGHGSLACAQFDGSNDNHDWFNDAGSAKKNLSVFVSTTPFDFVALVPFKMVDDGNDAAAAYDLKQIWGEEGGYVGIGLRTSGGVHTAVGWGYDTAVRKVEIVISKNVWYVARLRKTGGVLYFSIDGGSESSVACAALGSAANAMHIGASYNHGVFFGGYIGEPAVYNTGAPGGTDLADATAFLTDRWLEGGDIEITPTPISAAWSVVAPTLALALSAGPVSAAWSPVAPTLASSLAIDPISAAWSTVAPAIGNVVTVDPISASWSVVAPALAAALAVDPVSAAWSTVASSVGSSVDLSPVSAAWSVVTPTLAMALALSPVTATWSVAAVGFSDAGYNVYRRDLPDTEEVLVTTVPVGTEEVIVTGLAGSEQWFFVKAVTDCGVEDDEPIRMRRVAFDALGNLILPVPNAPVGLALTRGANGAITASWSYLSQNQEAAPTSFNVYVAVDEAAFNFASPAETVDFSGRRVFTADLGEFDHEAHVHVIVRAEAASGAEEKNLNQVTAIADAEAPESASDVEVEVIAS